jgi:hypothetical protein
LQLGSAHADNDDRHVPDPIRELLGLQDGVISRRQVLESGWATHSVRRMLRQGSWTQVHRGVYIAQTGPLTWRQRSWAAVLWAWPAALWGESALRAVDEHQGARPAGPIHVAVGRRRSGLRPPAGVRIHHMEHLDRLVLWNAGPPRVRVEEAALDVAAESASDVDAVAVLARWVQLRRTTPARLQTALDQRQRAPRRRWLQAVIADLDAGTCSVLEHGFLTRVERAHRLPRADRQRADRSSQGLVYRDADFGPVLVELDGRLFHDTSSARDRDLERDLDAAVDGRASVRLGWGQVFDRPCSTAAKLATVLARHGVVVRAVPCGPACALAAPRWGAAG